MQYAARETKSRPRPKLIDDAWEAQRASCFYDIMLILQLHTRLKVELDHGRGGARSRAGCPPSESSGGKVHAQPTDDMMYKQTNMG